jgi:hypothetical protein
MFERIAASLKPGLGAADEQLDEQATDVAFTSQHRSFGIFISRINAPNRFNIPYIFWHSRAPCQPDISVR